MLLSKIGGRETAAMLCVSLSIMISSSNAWGQTATDLNCAGCVEGSEIQNGTIGPNKLIPGSVNARTIANRAIGPNKLIPGSINTATIANNSITSNKIVNGAVTSTDIAVNTIGQDDIATDGVGAREIAPNAVGNSEIAARAVGTSEVINGSLSSDDLANEAGVEFIGGGNLVQLQPNGSRLIIRSVTLTAPTSGFAVAIATAGIRRPNTPGVTNVGCGLSEEFTFFTDVVSVDVNQDLQSATLAKTSVFPVDAGSNQIHLICFQNAISFPSPNDVIVDVPNSSLTVLFVPTRY